MISPHDITMTSITDSGARTVTAHPGCLHELVELAKVRVGHTGTAAAIVVDLVPRILLMQAEGLMELHEPR